MAKDKKLTDKQELFCLEYIKDLNATQAYLRAGYKAKDENVASAAGTRLLGNVNIAHRINELQTERAKEIKLDANWVLERLKMISDRCVQAEAVLDREGNETGEYKFDAAGANKATELIGKHLGLFTEKVEVSGEMIYQVKPNNLLAPEED